MPALRALSRALAYSLIATSAVFAQNSPVRPGDKVVLRILRDTLVQDTLRVDPNGSVVIPFAGDVALGSLPANAVQDTLRARLARFMNPNVVEAVVLRRVRVMGEVGKPGVYYLDRTSTLRDAIAVAGGVTTIGEEKHVTLLRGGDTLIHIDDWRTDKAGAAPVESGDELTVARLPWYKREILAIVSGIGILASIIITLSK